MVLSGAIWLKSLLKKEQRMDQSLQETLDYYREQGEQGLRKG